MKTAMLMFSALAFGDTAPANPTTAADSYLPGTKGTVLFISAGTKIDVKQVGPRERPEIRITFGRRSVQARVVRFYFEGSYFIARVGLKGFEIVQGPKAKR